MTGPVNLGTDKALKTLKSGGYARMAATSEQNAIAIIKGLHQLSGRKIYYRTWVDSSLPEYVLISASMKNPRGVSSSTWKSIG